ncbi:hypothetical protein [Halorussus marinus]|uniref:hypothetical protein n=1 Tax=Halorussus marinus TaxID=2505976 RepID=UPI001091C4EF|nr:hypothetical protein [Halorussus marinus]
MAKRDILEEVSDGDDWQNWEWLVAKSLLDANAHSSRAFEQHLLYTYHADADGDSEEMCRHIERAIEEHERIIEHLELAAQATDGAEFQDSPDTS